MNEVVGSFRHFTSTDAMITSNCRDLRLSDCRWDAINLFISVTDVLENFQGSAKHSQNLHGGTNAWVLTLQEFNMCLG